jgi:hypothetical protein
MVTRFLTSAFGFLLILGGLACNEEFTPKADIQEQVVVYAIASVSRPAGSGGFTATISAVVMRSFDVEGVNPAGATIDPSIRGAMVRVSDRYTSLTLPERRRVGVDSVTGIGPRWCYSLTTGAVQPGDSLSLTVDLPDGRRLTAHTQVPPYRLPSTYPDYRFLGVTTRLDPYFWGSSWNFEWTSAPGDQDLFFIPLYLVYERMEDSAYVGYTRQVPIRMVSQGGIKVPEYPGAFMVSRVEYPFDALDATMLAISEGDPEKSRYRITGFTWEFSEFDFALSRYYASVNGYLDAYSVRLDQTVFSNISGGIGLFGSSCGYTERYAIDSRYAERFGYTSP